MWPRRKGSRPANGRMSESMKTVTIHICAAGIFPASCVLTRRSRMIQYWQEYKVWKAQQKVIEDDEDDEDAVNDNDNNNEDDNDSEGDDGYDELVMSDIKTESTQHRGGDRETQSGSTSD